MAKKKVWRKGRGVARSADSIPCRVAGSAIFTVATIVSGSSQTRYFLCPGSTPSLSDLAPRIATMADRFQLYRYHSLRFHFLASSTGSTELGVVAFTGGQDQAYSTMQGVSQLISAVALPGQTTPACLTLTRSDLVGDKPWYDVATEIGKSVIFSTYSVATGALTADSLTVRVEFDMEFRMPAESSLTARLHTSGAELTMALARDGIKRDVTDEKEVIPVTLEQLRSKGFVVVPETTIVQL